MTPAIVDLTMLTAPESLSPASAPGDRSKAASFRDMLQQANNRREPSTEPTRNEALPSDHNLPPTDARRDAESDRTPPLSDSRQKPATEVKRGDCDERENTSEIDGERPDDAEQDNLPPDADAVETPVVVPSSAVVVEAQQVDVLAISPDILAGENVADVSPAKPNDKAVRDVAAQKQTARTVKPIDGEFSPHDVLVSAPDLATEQSEGKTKNIESADTPSPTTEQPTAESVEQAATPHAVEVAADASAVENAGDGVTSTLFEATAAATKTPTTDKQPVRKSDERSSEINSLIEADRPTEIAPTTTILDAATTTTTINSASAPSTESTSATNFKSAGEPRPQAGSSQSSATGSDVSGASSTSHPTSRVHTAMSTLESVTDAGTAQLSQADRARFIQRVARALQTAPDRGGELRLRLSPPELGSLRLHVRLTDGVLSARIEAETLQAKQLLTDNLAVLRDRLSEQNIRVDRFEVDLFQSAGGGAPGLPDRRQDDGHDAPDRRSRLGSTAGKQEDSTGKSSTRHGPMVGGGGLNVLV